MKKIYLFLLMLIVGIGSSWADITPGYYVLKLGHENQTVSETVYLSNVVGKNISTLASLQSTGTIFYINNSGTGFTLQVGNSTGKYLTCKSNGWDADFSETDAKVWYFDAVTGADDSYYIRRSGGADYIGTDNTNITATNSVWTNVAKNKSGSQGVNYWTLVPCYAVTYKYTCTWAANTDTFSTSKTIYYPKGTHVTTAAAPDFYTPGAITAFDVTEDVSKDVTLTPNFPFTAGSNVFLHNPGTSRFVTRTSDDEISTATATAANGMSSVWQFVHVVNSVNQFYLVNKLEDKYLERTESSGSYYAKLGNTQQAYEIVPSTVTGYTSTGTPFCIKYPTDTNSFAGAHIGGGVQNTIDGVSGYFAPQMGFWTSASSTTAGTGNIFFASEATNKAILQSLIVVAQKLIDGASCPGGKEDENGALATAKTTAQGLIANDTTITTVHISALQSAINTYNAGTNVNTWTPSIPSGSTITQQLSTATSFTAATSADDNTHWYLMSQTRGGESLAYYSSSDTHFMRGATTVTAASLEGTTATDKKAYLFRFIKSATGSAYNIQIADGSFMKSSNATSNGATVEIGEYGTFLVDNLAAGHIAINATSDGSTYGQKLNNNGATYSLSWWGSGKTTTTGGNVDWTIYEVSFIASDAADATVTYNLKIDGTKAGEYSTKVKVGAFYPEPQLPSTATVSSDYYTLSAKPTGAVTTTSVTKDITVTQNTPFVISESYDKATWETLKMDSKYNYYLYYQENQTYIPLTVTNHDYTDKYLFCFVGDVINGFKIYNKAAGSGMELASSTAMSGTTGDGTFPLLTAIASAEADGMCYLWDVTKSSSATNGFFLGQHNTNSGNNRMNNRNDGQLAYWTGGAGDGSTFVASPYTVEGVLAELQSLGSVSKITITSGATVVNPSEFEAGTLNSSIDAINNGGYTSETSLSDLVTAYTSSDAQYIRKCIILFNQNGNPLSVDYTQSAEYGTMILPINFNRPSGFKTYTCAGASGTTLTLVENTDGSDKNKPYIVKASTGTYQFIGYSNGAGTSDVTVDCLTGKLSDDATYVPANSYILSKYNDKLGFYKVSADNIYTAAKYKCYYTPATPQEAARAAFYFPGDDTPTAIESIFGGENEAVANGKFIQNGKMVIVKDGVKYNAAGQRFVK